jgi:hypothetical protein
MIENDKYDSYMHIAQQPHALGQQKAALIHRNTFCCSLDTETAGLPGKGMP